MYSARVDRSGRARRSLLAGTLEDAVGLALERLRLRGVRRRLRLELVGVILVLLLAGLLLRLGRRLLKLLGLLLLLLRLLHRRRRRLLLLRGDLLVRLGLRLP